MTAKRVSIWIGAGVAVIALLVALTVVPVVVEPGMSTVGHAEASTGVGSEECSAVSFDGTFSYAVARPILNPWGVAEVRDLTIDHVAMSGPGKAACGNNATHQMSAWVILPTCDHGFSEASQLVQSGWFTDCDGHAVVYAGETDEDQTYSTWTFEGPTSLPDSGLFRGTWCPGVGFTVQAGGASSSAGADEDSVCLAIS
ncbi:hypothetical protein [Demequina sp.]|uniref:hypothetical protein n=1 Tax=Demequina sp. TaxID=2050685 RepID=UPI003D11C659